MSDNSGFNTFSTNRGDYGNYGNREFMESNGLVAKFAFLLMVLVAFLFLLRIGISVVTWLLSPNKSPKLFTGMVDATQMLYFPQDPSMNGAVTIYRSVNATDGIEFSWSVWIYITDLQYLQGQYKHVFYKGNANLEQNGLNYPNNAPGLYISPNTNELVVMMNTFNVINEEVTIPDIPLNKWVNVIIRCQETTLDVFINGTISRSIQLTSVPKQNYGDVYVGANGGFSGYTSNLWYYDYALGTAAIQSLVSSGPNTNMVGGGGMDLKNPNYLSLRWFFYGDNDGYNP
jgi:hypothetical protein